MIPNYTIKHNQLSHKKNSIQLQQKAENQNKWQKPEGNQPSFKVSQVRGGGGSVLSLSSPPQNRT